MNYRSLIQSSAELAIWVSAHLLTHEQLEMQRCIISTVATDVLVPKHQAISIHSVDSVLTVLPKLHINILHLIQTMMKTELIFWKKIWSSYFRVNVLSATHNKWSLHGRLLIKLRFMNLQSDWTYFKSKAVCHSVSHLPLSISSPPGQNGRHFADDIFKYISLNENLWISINISL